MKDRATFREASQLFKSLFYEELQLKSSQLMPIVEKMAAVMTVSEKLVKHRWFADIPEMRQWVGARQIKFLEARGYTVESVKYESTIAVDADDLQWDKLGLVKPRIMNMSEAAAKLPYRSLATIIENAATGLAWDGNAMYSASHTSGSNVTDDVYDTDAYIALKQKMMAQVDDNGNRLGIRPTHIYYAYDLEADVLNTFKAQNLASGASNTLYNDVELMYFPDLPAGHWGIMDLSRSIKPFIWQQSPVVTGLNSIAGLVEFAMQDNPQVHDNTFLYDQNLYGTKRWGVAAYGVYQLAAGSDGSGS